MFENIVKHYKNFPQEGIDFIDVMPFLQNKEVYRSLIKEIGQMVSTPNVATMEARGFLFAAPLLTDTEHVHNIVPLRKKGKLPFVEGDLKEVVIMKEYGSDMLYYRLSDLAACTPNGDTLEVTLFDDLLATGGTALGLAQKLNGERVTIDGKSYTVKVKEFIFLVEITNLPGREVLEPIAPVKSVVKVQESL